MNVRNLTLAAAAVLVIGVVGGVLLFAVPRPPGTPTLVADPTALGVDPGRLAWVDWDREEGRCLVVVDAGAVSERRCTAEVDGEVIGWDGDEVVLDTFGSSGRRTTVRVDVTTGATRSSSTADDDPTGWHDEQLGRDGTVLDVDRDDGRLTVRVDGEVVWEVDAPDAYTIDTAQRSNDGQLVLLQDSAGRVLVARADGRAAPRVWLEEQASWQPLAWDRATREVAA